MSIRRFIVQITSAILGLYLATRFIPNVQILGGIKTLLLAGLVLAVFNYFVKPILKIITLPLRLVTFGLFSFVLNMALLWAADILFSNLIIKGLAPLFLSSMIIWGLGLVLSLIIREKH